MNVTLNAFNLTEKRVRGKNNLDVEYFEDDFFDCIRLLCAKNPVDKKYKLIDTNKVIYIDNFEYSKDKHLLFLVFKSAEYGVVRKVVNTDTLKEQPDKKKGSKDGDEETTCMLIRFDSDADSKNAICLTQVNSRGASMSKILEYLNIHIVAIHDAHHDNIKYYIGSSAIVSQDFLDALEKTNKIKLVKLVVDSSEADASEFKKFAEPEDISENFDIIYKPSKVGVGIGKDTVRKFFDYYKSEKKTIKRICIDSKTADGNPLSFDTDKMREKVHITVDTNINGEPEVENIKLEMCSKISMYY